MNRARSRPSKRASAPATRTALRRGELRAWTPQQRAFRAAEAVIDRIFAPYLLAARRRSRTFYPCGQVSVDGLIVQADNVKVTIARMTDRDTATAHVSMDLLIANDGIGLAAMSAVLVRKSFVICYRNGDVALRLKSRAYSATLTSKLGDPAAVTLSLTGTVIDTAGI